MKLSRPIVFTGKNPCAKKARRIVYEELLAHEADRPDFFDNFFFHTVDVFCEYGGPYAVVPDKARGVYRVEASEFVDMYGAPVGSGRRRK